MTVDAMLDGQSIERETAEVIGTRLSQRLRIATRAIQQGVGTRLESYHGKLALSSAGLFAVQGAIALSVARGMGDGTFHDVLALGFGTAALKGAEFVRDNYLQDVAAQTHQ